MSVSSPFSSNRYEYEREHVYYLDAELLHSVLGHEPKPVYLIGARGTGKTTLLMSLEWRERMTNNSLRSQLGSDPFHSSSGEMLGVYLKLPAIQLQSIEGWITTATDDQVLQAAVVSTYLDLVWLEKLTDGVAALLSSQDLTPSVALETDIVQAVCHKYPSSFKSPTGRIRTIAQLTSAIARLRLGFERAAITRMVLDEFLESTDCVGGSLGSLGREIARQLVRLCVRGDAGSGSSWHFRVCMDEGEALSNLQLLVLNSMVRLAEWPVFFVVAFVRQPSEPSRTLIPQLSLQAADRELVPLADLLTDTRFRKLVEGVISVRVERQLGAEPPSFSLEQIVGDYDINSLLRGILTDSVSPQAKDLLRRASELAKIPFFQDQYDHEKLPIYQAYLVDKLNIELPKRGASSWKRRKQNSAELRKRNVAAYLAICADLGVSPRFAGMDMLIGVSDGSIRDLLRFLDGIYTTSGRELLAFIGTPTPESAQDRAFSKASSAKLDGIRSSGVGSVSEIENLVNGLGALTAKLQSTSESGANLRSSERGIFSLTPIPSDWSALTPVLEAGEAGYLQLLSVGADTLEFRMHTSLAPAFGFSYRGAYYKVPLQWSDMDYIIRSGSPREARERGGAVAQQESSSTQHSLFEF